MNKIIKTLLLMFFLLKTYMVLAVIDDPPEPIPIDGGISYLLIAGAVYGVTRLLKIKQPKDE